MTEKEEAKGVDQKTASISTDKRRCEKITRRDFHITGRFSSPMHGLRHSLHALLQNHARFLFQRNQAIK